MTDAAQMLDLLAAEDSEGIEPTIAAGRRTLYSDVRIYFPLLCFRFIE